MKKQKIKTTSQSILRLTSFLNEKIALKEKGGKVDLFGCIDVANLLAKLGVETFNPQGGWTRHGYERIRKHAKIDNYKKLLNIIKKIDVKKTPKKLTNEEKKENWIKKLSKLTNITIEQASDIAQGKLDYKEEKIQEMMDRQYCGYSKKREVLIDKMRRANPLRTIKNQEHAQNIMIASNRHNNSDYEECLDDARESAEMGLIDRGDIKSEARLNYQLY